MKSLLCFFLILLLCSPLIAQSVSSAESATLALVNGRFWTGLEATPWAEAVAIKGQKIIRVGMRTEINQVIAAETQVIDLGGRLAAPGFNDAHLHFLGGSLGLTQVDLTGAQSVKEMQRRVAEFAKQNSTANWITGRGWEYVYLPGSLPNKRDLDAIVKDRPVYLRAYDGHTGWANSRALQLAGVTRETKFEGFGEIIRDAQTGEPTGALTEGAQSLVARLIPESSREEKLNALRQGIKLTASLGITSLQNAGGSPDELLLYEELLKRNELSLRVSVAFSVNAKTSAEQLERFVALREKFSLNPALRAGAVKFVLDGVIESHTAAMLDPYSDKPDTRGTSSHTPEDYNAAVERFDRAGFQIYTHAIGDRAVRMTLDAYERAQQKNPRSNPRHRVEHIETISAEDIARFAKLGVMASMEPIHADPGTIEVWSRAVGEDRVKRAFAWNAFHRSGAWLVFSSDWPASISLDPIRGLHNAVNRRTTDGKPKEGWIPEQKISLQQALRAYTVTGAYASFEEGIKGTLAPGMLADVIVFSQDLFKIEPMKIHETHIVLTVFDGKAIYRDSKRFPK